MQSVQELSVGEIMRKYRQYQGLTLKQLSVLSNVNETYIGDIERGKVSPGAKILQKLARALGVSSSHLLGEVDFLSPWPAGE